MDSFIFYPRMFFFNDSLFLYHISLTYKLLSVLILWATFLISKLQFVSTKRCILFHMALP